MIHHYIEYTWYNYLLYEWGAAVFYAGLCIIAVVIAIIIKKRGVQ